jgi:hypothetical protein
VVAVEESANQAAPVGPRSPLPGCGPSTLARFQSHAHCANSRGFRRVMDNEPRLDGRLARESRDFPRHFKTESLKRVARISTRRNALWSRIGITVPLVKSGAHVARYDIGASGGAGSRARTLGARHLLSSWPRRSTRARARAPVVFASGPHGTRSQHHVEPAGVGRKLERDQR